MCLVITAETLPQSLHECLLGLLPLLLIGEMIWRSHGRTAMVLNLIGSSACKLHQHDGSYSNSYYSGVISSFGSMAAGLNLRVTLVGLNGEQLFTIDADPSQRIADILALYKKSRCPTDMTGYALRLAFQDHVLSTKTTLQQIRGQKESLIFTTVAVDIVQLKKAGWSARALRNDGYSATELRAAGYSIFVLKHALYDTQELRDAGFSLKELQDAALPIAKFVTPHDIRESGCTLRGIVNENSPGELLSSLRDAGFSLQELYHSGASEKTLISIGCTAMDFSSAGWQLSHLLKIFTVRALSDNGFSLPEMLQILHKETPYYNDFPQAELQHLGYTMEELKDLGYPAVAFFLPTSPESIAVRAGFDEEFYALEERDVDFLLHTYNDLTAEMVEKTIACPGDCLKDLVQRLHRQRDQMQLRKDLVQRLHRHRDQRQLRKNSLKSSVKIALRES